ncbi:unnamed protein product [Staurois parvus]|uniref:Uncharacterized protein n=1 Tax=Staurois parvus TaxID=386267 RepID=A0ABN9C9S7_9NEOB|nr:unnamed protein product [Staurois parvus]
MKVIASTNGGIYTGNFFYASNGGDQQLIAGLMQSAGILTLTATDIPSDTNIVIIANKKH